MDKDFLEGAQKFTQGNPIFRGGGGIRGQRGSRYLKIQNLVNMVMLYTGGSDFFMLIPKKYMTWGKKKQYF